MDRTTRLAVMLVVVSGIGQVVLASQYFSDWSSSGSERSDRVARAPVTSPRARSAPPAEPGHSLARGASSTSSESTTNPASTVAGALAGAMAVASTGATRSAGTPGPSFYVASGNLAGGMPDRAAPAAGSQLSAGEPALPRSESGSPAPGRTNGTAGVSAEPDPFNASLIALAGIFAISEEPVPWLVDAVASPPNPPPGTELAAAAGRELASDGRSRDSAGEDNLRAAHFQAAETIGQAAAQLPPRGALTRRELSRTPNDGLRWRAVFTYDLGGER